MNTDKPDLINALGKIATYVDGTHVEHRFRKLTIPVVEYNEAKKIIEEYLTPLQSKISSLESDRERLLSALRDATERMTRARGILTKLHGHPDCWQMLNADKTNELITEIESK